MSAVFAFPRYKRTAIALTLCLLAFAFAMETKLVGYGRSHAPDNEMRAAKACPADTLDLLAHSLPILVPFPTQVLLVFVAAFAFLSLRRGDTARLRFRATSRNPAFFTYSYPPLFFRPPPSVR